MANIALIEYLREYAERLNDKQSEAVSSGEGFANVAGIYSDEESSESIPMDIAYLLQAIAKNIDAEVSMADVITLTDCLTMIATAYGAEDIDRTGSFTEQLRNIVLAMDDSVNVENIASVGDALYEFAEILEQKSNDDAVEEQAR